MMPRLYAAADLLNRRNLKDLVRDRPYEVMCDLGCDDGKWTAELARYSRSAGVFGVEIAAERARLAHLNGVQATISDLNQEFPFDDGSFDLVHSNQVIEHVKDVDHFISETVRVLRNGGIAVISTENGSSWHNIFAAVMGWQVFSLTSVSTRARSLGNPLALHRNDPPRLVPDTHHTIFNYQGLIDIVGMHGLTILDVRGAGYYPLPATVGNLDVRHCHFITVKAAKLGRDSAISNEHEPPRGYGRDPAP